MNPRTLAIAALALAALVFGLDLVIWLLHIAHYGELLPRSFEFLRLLGHIFTVLGVLRELSLLGCLSCLGCALLAMTRPAPRPAGYYPPPGW
jgi:hypothetical protein